MAKEEANPPENPTPTPMAVPATPSGASENKKPIRKSHPKQQKFNTRADVARAMEGYMSMMLSGIIDGDEMKIFISVLKSIADQLPKGGASGATTISDRLRAKLKNDHELLNELADVLPADVVEGLMKGDGE
jgi:hypothetical protein